MLPYHRVQNGDKLFGKDTFEDVHGEFSLYFYIQMKIAHLRKIFNGLLVGLALVMAAAQMVFRFHAQRKLLPDDFVLIFACLTFIVSQILLYIVKMENVY